MFKAFKYRLYPTAPQAEKINQNIGCARFVYNQLLDDRIKVYHETKQRSKKTYSILKEEHRFLKNADSRALKHSQANLDEAYEKFKKEPNIGYPKFKAKHKCRWSYTTDNNNAPFVSMATGLDCQRLVSSKLLNIDCTKGAF